MSELLTGTVIKQLNLGYDSLQDRLLLRLGLADETEITVWLTRRMVKALWPMLQGLNVASLVGDHVFSTQQSLENFASAIRNKVQQMDFAETYEPGRIARIKAPLLPSECRILSVDSTPSALELQSRDGNTVRIPLSAELTNALVNMLQLATKEAAWDITLAPSLAVITSTTRRPVLH